MQQSIRHNFLMNVILRISSILFPLITFQYVSRVLLPAGVGRVSFATAFVAYFNMAAQLGIPTYGIRACAMVRDDRNKLSRVTLELLLLNLIGTLAAYLAIGICILCIPRVKENGTIFLILSLSIFLNAIGMEWLYQGLEKYTYITVRSLVFKAFALLAVFLLVRKQEDILVYTGLTIFASSASNVLNFLHARRYVSFHTCFDDHYAGGICLRRHVKPVIVLFAMVCAVTVFSNLDEVMLGFIKTDAEVGYYHAAVKIKIALVDMITALSVVLLPRASYYVEHGQMNEFRRIIDRGLHFVIISGTGLSVYFMLYAEETIFCLFGNAFEASVLPMILIMPVVLLTGMTRVMGNQILIPQGKEKIVLYSVTAGAASDVVLNLFLIPQYGPTGAVMGTFAAECLIVIIQYPYVKSEVSETLRCLHTRWMIGVLALSIVSSIWVKFLPINYTMKLILSGLLFFAVYCGVLIFSKDPMVLEIYCWIKEKIK